MCLTHRKKAVIIIVFASLLIVSCIIFLMMQPKNNNNTDNKPTETTSENKTLDFEPYEDNRIVIPGFEGIHFEPYITNQSINFYNPKENNCYFVISLFLSDDTCIYQSDYLSPGEQITDITLLEPLEKGIYRNCILQYRCYNLANKTELNGSTQNITISTK